MSDVWLVVIVSSQLLFDSEYCGRCWYLRVGILSTSSGYTKEWVLTFAGKFRIIGVQVAQHGDKQARCYWPCFSRNSR